MSRIASSIPGRIRVRDPKLRLPERLERLRAVLAAGDGVASCEANPATGSLLLHYDAAAVAPELMEAFVDAAVDAELVSPRPDTAAIRANRYAKQGMLASLAVSLAFAATGKKRWHALSGGLFLAGLGIHLAYHRQRLLK